MSEVLNTSETKLQNTLQTILSLMDLEVEVQATTKDEVIHLQVLGKDAEIARGKKGEVLDALQYVLGKLLGKAGMTQQRVLLDIGSFRAEREDSIKQVADFLSEKAIALQKPIAIHPMGSHDRRVIHLALQKKGVSHSQSEGDGMARRLLVIPGKAPEEAPRAPRRPPTQQPAEPIAEKVDPIS